MNARGSRLAVTPLLGAPVRALERFNTRHPFSHNDHFHPWILAELPESRRRALDVGCGEGLLAARLAERFEHVDAADSDPGMRTATARRCAGLPVTVIDGFDDVAGAIDGQADEAADGATAGATATYDAITMVATLHHLPLKPTLRRCRDLLAPGGRLLVVGLARQTLGPRDLVWELGSVIANPVMGFVRHPRPHRGERPQPPFPVAHPEHCLAEVAAAAHDILPGARVARRIPFRYTLRWTKPDPARPT